MDTEYYRLSGKVAPVGLAFAVALGSLITLALAFVYAAALVYNPSAYLGLALPLLYGGAAGGFVAALGQRFKTRNARVLAIAGTCVAMVGYVVSWVPWEWLALTNMGSRIDVVAVLYPPSFLQMLSFIYENGAWSIGGAHEPVAGALLGAVWALEAIAVFASSAAVAFGVGGHGVFCETCEAWCKLDKDLLRHEGARAADMTRKLDARDFSVLETAPRATPGASAWVETGIASCPCGATNTLLVEQCTRGKDGRGKSRFERLPLIKHLLVTKAEADRIRAIPLSPRRPRDAR